MDACVIGNGQDKLGTTEGNLHVTPIQEKINEWHL